MLGAAGSFRAEVACSPGEENAGPYGAPSTPFTWESPIVPDDPVAAHEIAMPAYESREYVCVEHHNHVQIVRQQFIALKSTTRLRDTDTDRDEGRSVALKGACVMPASSELKSIRAAKWRRSDKFRPVLKAPSGVGSVAGIF